MLGLLIAVDVAVIIASLSAATLLRAAGPIEPLWVALGLAPKPLMGAWTSVHTALLVFQVLAIPFGLLALGQYHGGRANGPTWTFNRTLLVAMLTHLAAIAVLYTLGLRVVPRTVLALDLALLVAGLVGWRHWWTRRAWKRLARGQGLRNVLFIGAGATNQRLAVELVRHPGAHGRRVVGFLSNEPGRALTGVPRTLLARPDVWAGPVGLRDNARPGVAPVVVENVTRQPVHLLAVVGTLATDEVDASLDGLLVEEVFLASTLERATIGAIVRTCKARGVDVHIVPEHYPELAWAHEANRLGPFTVMGLHRRPMSALGWTAKRALDIVGALAGLVLSAPFIFLAALAIKLENPRAPIFYPGTRVGLRGRHFKILKLSTMVPDADDRREELAAQNAREGPWFQLEPEDDPRITPVGRFLRRYTLNELPQFWNVLKGEMSLVGPRPLAVDEVARFVDYDFRYYRCFDVKPGMTSLWAVGARSDPSFERRIELDFAYMDHWSVWLDVKLLFLTLASVVREPGR